MAPYRWRRFIRDLKFKNRIRDKRKSGKRNGKYRVRFDKEVFYLDFGIGLSSIAFGLFLSWAILTASEGTSDWTGYTLSQRIAQVLSFLSRNG